ncbi:ATP-binding protein [Leptospira sp. 2 VSF19]|uniref:histidine kinase n=1 Tax=Leptospira soteropolitanensis TaxID=2950025 RepID=A0AAW5VCS3_9LEPT|nr:ATP-binding protein [Leptospira soteropolitanensis]MCW7491358.1 ATP-binding protein [Leptospira soteropolitanensis]MCW7498943.1 ATP-binding protein [Leptospira soteropolitanensis]MCW7521465.1 ATP-binding protein [Leptospira soteropolitanensis]MCW7525046.1 ATP-binding protein [Leptospira soteropolitanensis]MCW7528914.1 ATP-binding protein [Leptospira soteropolitanensis]
MNSLSEKHLLTIIKKSGIGILILDKNLNIVLTNTWFIKSSGIKEKNLIGASFLDIFPELTNTRTFKSIKLCLEFSQYSILTHTLNPFPFPLFDNEKNRESGNRIFQYLHIIPISIEDETDSFCMIQISDVSQQVVREKLLREKMTLANQREIEAQKASQAKTDFLASMSHEIRTPLNAILGMTDTLNETELTDEQQEYLTVLRNSGKALFNIINDILDLSRIESGKFEMEHIHFSIRDLMKETVSLFYMKAQAKGINIKCNIDEEISESIAGDSTRLQQVLINLLSNAMKFTESGSIVVNTSLGENKKNLLISVEDTGIGIPSEKLHSIFESFTQVDSSTTRKYGGTGLGLTITKKLIQLMGGEISVVSQVGIGSEFSFEIPYEGFIKRNSDIHKHWLNLELPEPQNFPNCNVLLAEDSEENIFIIKTFFRKYPINISVAYNGKEAVRKYKSQKFDIILMDMQMPEMDGLEATREIRKIEVANQIKASDSIPIIAISANVQKEDISKSFLAGITSYLPKPVRKQEILKLMYFYLVM